MYVMLQQTLFSGAGNVTWTVDSDLSPYSLNSYFVQACNSIGCINSSVSSAYTLPAGQ